MSLTNEKGAWGEHEDTGVSVRGDGAGAMQIGLTLDTMLLAPCSYQM